MLPRGLSKKRRNVQFPEAETQNGPRISLSNLPTEMALATHECVHNDTDEPVNVWWEETSELNEDLQLESNLQFGKESVPPDGKATYMYSRFPWDHKLCVEYRDEEKPPPNDKDAVCLEKTAPEEEGQLVTVLVSDIILDGKSVHDRSAPIQSQLNRRNPYYDLISLKVSTLELHGNVGQYFIPGLFSLISFMLALVGNTIFSEVQSVSRGLQMPLMQT